MADEGEAKVARGASLLILLQIVSRAITFVANQILVRFLTAQLLGISTQLEVFYLSVIFFARESLRVAVQRQGSVASRRAKPQLHQDQNGAHQRERGTRQAAETQTVVNLGYISNLLGLVAAVVLGSAYLRSVSAETVATTPNFIASVYLYALASILELLSEPVFVVMQIRLNFGARASAEAVATFAKCLVTLASAVWASRNRLELGVLPFALGQTAFSLGLLGVYAYHGTALAAREGFSLLPKRLGPTSGTTSKTTTATSDYVLSYFYRPTVNLASSMMLQSFVKHLLTQGDTFLVSILSTPQAQGVYALANNYGGLLARLVLQPIEESSRSHWSRLLSATATIDTNQQQQPSPSPEEQQDADVQQTRANPEPSPAALNQASENLTTLLQGYTLASLPLLAFGPVAAPLVLSIVAGPQWTASGAGDALAVYVYYIPLLAINGLTEAFVASVATEAQVHRQSAWMMGFSLVFAVAGYVFMRVLAWGAIGLVCANAINMACRIVWAVVFIQRYFAHYASSSSSKGTSWEFSRVLPKPATIVLAAVAAQVVRRVTPGSVGAQELLGFKAVIGELLKIAGVVVPFLVTL
ncbi:Rft protein-domain-containing protein [Coniella lustricola]|uniref:Man(5)GlcNAc(2)-PP-dolichol translocation protein RFT1 n=1 Tax=Coniella lustricola TaxID=2025994 RepID=A0A2T3AB22_9PEZI|nr:Rft protein-domain-containing protein [Coniella lustricola]